MRFASSLFVLPLCALCVSQSGHKGHMGHIKDSSLFDLYDPYDQHDFYKHDTTINGVDVEFTYTSSIFPETWTIAPISATGEKILTGELQRTYAIVSKALYKYPGIVLEYNLKYVYLLKSMKFYNVGYGGTNSNDAVYLTNNGLSMGYSDTYIEQTFHHEFSSILFRNYLSLFDTTNWKKTNVSGFDYNDPENGVGAIRNNQSSQDIDTVLCKQGFLTQYALSSLENDMNTLSQNLFLPAKGFWEAVDRYPRIRKKVSILVDFYSNISGQFTETYFRKFKSP